MARRKQSDDTAQVNHDITTFFPLSKAQRSSQSAEEFKKAVDVLAAQAAGLEVVVMPLFLSPSEISVGLYKRTLMDIDETYDEVEKKYGQKDCKADELAAEMGQFVNIAETLASSSPFLAFNLLLDIGEHAYDDIDFEQLQFDPRVQPAMYSDDPPDRSGDQTETLFECMDRLMVRIIHELGSTGPQEDKAPNVKPHKRDMGRSFSLPGCDVRTFSKQMYLRLQSDRQNDLLHLIRVRRKRREIAGTRSWALNALNDLTETGSRIERRHAKLGKFYFPVTISKLCRLKGVDLKEVYTGHLPIPVEVTPSSGLGYVTIPPKPALQAATPLLTPSKHKAMSFKLDHRDLDPGLSKSTQSHYTYQPLEGPSSIRVVTLQPSTSFDSDLSCDIVETVLDDTGADSEHATYEALSYTWGSDEFSATICIGGWQTLRVTASLADALRHLRLYDRPRTLWIDNICINQSDVAEKGRQVFRMGDIYRRAEAVIVWLGSGDASVREAFSFLQKVAVSSVAWPIPARVLHDEQFSPALEPDPDADGDAQKRAFEALTNEAVEVGADAVYRLPWFSRIWVVQEVSLARSAVLVYEKETLDWELLDRVTITLLSTLKGRYFSHQVNAKSYRLQASLQPANTIMRVRHHVLRSRSYIFVDDWLEYGWIASALSKHGCKDDRDRVYSTLHLFPKGSLRRHTLIPDYTIGVEEVFSNFTRHMLRRSTDLGILLDAGLCNQGEPTAHPRLQLPSWAIDLRRDLSNGWGPFSNLSSFCAATSSPVVVSDTTQPCRIRVGGFILDDAVELTLGGSAVEPDAEPEIVMTPAGFEPTRSSIVTMIDRARKERYSHIRSLCGGGPVETLAFAACADGFNSTFHGCVDGEYLEKAGQVAELWRGMMESCISEDGEVFQWHQRLLKGDFEGFPTEISEDGLKASCFMQGFAGMFTASTFWFGKKCFGVGPKGMKSDGSDCIAILNGARMPFVVRKVEGADEFQLVGPCYSAGFMRGEAAALRADDESSIFLV
ncbi:hypothetical protein OQA88_8356 [Cercophora sp. LCS_1]